MINRDDAIIHALSIVINRYELCTPYFAASTFASSSSFSNWIVRSLFPTSEVISCDSRCATF